MATWDTFALVGDREILFDMNIVMGGRIAGKQYMPSLIIEDPLRAPLPQIYFVLCFGP